jgi:hypothetical protein
MPQTNKGDNNKELVYGYDLSLLVNTYDDMILRYVNTGVTASSYKHDIEYYNSLIYDFSNDSVSEKDKEFLLNENAKILNAINDKLTLYEKLANNTIEEYYNRLVASDIKQVLSVNVSQSISAVVFIGAGFVFGFLISCVAYIFIEILKRYKKNALKEVQAEEENKALSVIEKPLSKEELLMIQHSKSYEEFVCRFEPIFDANSKVKAKRMIYEWNKLGYEEIDALAKSCELYREIKLWGLKAIAENIEDKLEEEGVRKLRMEGLKEGQWVLLDYGSVVIHVFQERDRQFYNLEHLWGDARVVHL